MKSIIKRIFFVLWDYFKSMNSEKDGNTVSIKRNMAWGVATATLLIEFYCTYHFVKITYKNNENVENFLHFIYFIISVDLIFVVLALRITSLEKINSLVQTVKGVNVVDKEKTQTNENSNN